MYNEFGPRGFQAVGLATNATAETASKLIGVYRIEQRLSFPIGWCTEDEFLSFLQLSVMAPRRVPQLVFLDRKGIIRVQVEGTHDFFRDEENSMRRTIESLLSEPAPAASGRKKA
jgi:hypothetical protein